MVLKGIDLILSDRRGTEVGSPRQEKNENNMFRKLVSNLVWPEDRACKGDQWEIKLDSRGQTIESWGPGVRVDRFSK